MVQARCAATFLISNSYVLCVTIVACSSRHITHIDSFFDKGGKWYYAGVYLGVQLEHLSPAEWSNLPDEVNPTFTHRRDVMS
jgi:hypothetical protein